MTTTLLPPLEACKLHYILDLTTSNINKITSHNYSNNYKYVPPRCHNGKESAYQCMRHKRCSFDPSVGKISGVGNGSLLQCSRLGDVMDRGAWRAIAMESQSQTRPRMHALCVGQCFIYPRVISHFNLYKCPVRLKSNTTSTSR